ncbi:DUF6894 family protein [Microvirga aerophila]|uniref:DUF6894 domain-containing protein n=1 Tax=Microvirga aerophila TaxID=670291 RepID=A0A512C4M0_9HYPH|nr:hypothetical protein [Microvirga aerophila]GEO19174.1 hypothetical protein MAE02_68700 [Microvirga aerophila]
MRCYFHLVNGHGFIPDETGLDVPDIEMAQHQALKAIQELRQEAGQTAEEWSGWRINVVDASGRVLLSLRLDTPLPREACHATLVDAASTT